MFPFLQGFEARKVERYKRGGLLPYKLDVYCRSRRVGVGVSETLLSFVSERKVPEFFFCMFVPNCTPKNALSFAHFLERFRTWAMAVKRGSYKSLFLLNSGRFSLEKYGIQF